ncbi:MULTISPECIES: MFS transporter [unclassified Streptomyces]|uniref:MFS transporter n=1 Tax=unclassified Streptomyces TaxID=2593676 RepID=UPI00380249F1
MRTGPRSASDLPSRLAVRLVFVVLGGTQGGWMARIPAIRDAVGLDTAEWGVLSTASAFGDVIALVLVTVLIGRVGNRLLSLAAATLVLANAPLLAGASTVPALVAGLALWGLSATFLATPVNALAVAVERDAGRPLMSGFHASYSCGVLAGGALGTLAAATGTTPGAQLAWSSGVLGTLLVILAPRLPKDHPGGRPKSERRSLRHRFTPHLLVLAGVAFLGSFVEGAASQWSSVYTADQLGEGAALGATTYTCFSVAILAGRLFGDRLPDRRTALRVCLLTLLTGVIVTLAHPSLPFALTGFVLIGLGISCVLPAVIVLAGRQSDVPAGEAVSVVSIGQWPGFLLAGPAVGVLANATSLRVALGMLGVAAVGALVLSGRVRVPVD